MKEDLGEVPIRLPVKSPFSIGQILILPVLLLYIGIRISNGLQDNYWIDDDGASIRFFIQLALLHILLPIAIWLSPTFLRHATQIIPGESGIAEVLQIGRRNFFLTHIQYSEIETVSSRIFLKPFGISYKNYRFTMNDRSIITLQTLKNYNHLDESLNSPFQITLQSKVLRQILDWFKRTFYSSKILRPINYAGFISTHSRNTIASHNRGRRVFNFTRTISIVFVAYFFLITTVFAPQNTDFAARTDEINAGVNYENNLELHLQVTDVDALSQIAQIQISPAPYGKYGDSVPNGWYPSDITYLDIASARRINDLQQSNEYVLDSKLQSNISATANTGTSYDPSLKCLEKSSSPTTSESTCLTWQEPKSSIKYYPFDEYHFMLPIMNVAQRSAGAQTTTEADDKWDAVPLKIWDWTTDLRSWDVTVNPVSLYENIPLDDLATVTDELNNGNANTLIIAKRDQYTILLVLIVVLLMIASMISVVLMGISVALRYRPPTVQALVWAAALTFSLIQLRTLMPDAPPVGTYLDLVFYFPALLITISGSIWILFHWIRRTDYQI